MWDTLISFYEIFGIEEEGPAPEDRPPAGQELGDEARDARVLRRMLDDPVLVATYRECASVLEDIASTAGDTALLEELDAHFELMDVDVDKVFNGIVWFAQATQADPRASSNVMHEQLGAALGPLAAMATSVTGAAMLRLYIALVYLRGDWFREAVGRAQLDDAPNLLR